MSELTTPAQRRNAAWSAMPTPAKLEAYERAAPGTAERMLALLEARQLHAQRIELDALRIRRLGNLLAFLSVLVLAAVASYFVSEGAPTQGAAVIVTGAVAVTGIFVTGRVASRGPAPKADDGPGDRGSGQS